MMEYGNTIHIADPSVTLVTSETWKLRYVQGTGYWEESFDGGPWRRYIPPRDDDDDDDIVGADDGTP